MFGIKRKDKMKDNQTMNIEFPLFHTYTHSQEINDMYYKLKEIQKNFYKNDSNSISNIVFPPSYYEEHALISTMKLMVKELLEKEFEKGETIYYVVNGLEIDTRDKEVKELPNGCLRVTTFSEKDITVENYVSWAARYKSKRMLSIKIVKELKQIKKELEKLKKQ